MSDCPPQQSRWWKTSNCSTWILSFSSLIYKLIRERCDSSKKFIGVLCGIKCHSQQRISSMMSLSWLLCKWTNSSSIFRWCRIRRWFMALSRLVDFIAPIWFFFLDLTWKRCILMEIYFLYNFHLVSCEIRFWSLWRTMRQIISWW